MSQDIYIIDENIECIKEIRKLFENEKHYTFKNVKTKHIDIALRNIPSLIIINEDSIDRDIIELCKTIREDEDNSITPIIVTSSIRDKDHRIKVLDQSVEYYIKNPIDNDYLYYTIKNLLRLMSINRTVSPLTGLPGNVQIHAEIKKRLLNKEEFAVFYLDLDNFKAYNDVYGFLKGDEIIKFTAKTISNNIHSIENNESFVGHIGGDDFVALVSKTDYDKVCQDIILEFDTNSIKFFTGNDVERGYLEVANRKGIIEEFPLTTISIGVVEITPDRFRNLLEIGEVGAQLKHQAKTNFGSSYIIDRRK